MEYIYQKNSLQFIKKEDLKQTLKNVKTSESIVDDEIITFLEKNLKTLSEYSEQEILSWNEGNKEYVDFFKKIKDSKIEFSKIELERIIRKNYQIIREKIAPLIYSDNINLLISNGCSIYAGSKGINGEAQKQLKNVLKNFNYDTKPELVQIINGYVDDSDLTPEKILDKLYQIDNFYFNIKPNDPVYNSIKNLIKDYQKTLLENYVLGINYKKPYLHEELLLKLLGIKKYNQINIFTLNYDILIETAAENLNILLNNGFQGFQTRKFNPANFSYKNFVETTDGSRKISKNINLIKLHGSLSWKFDDKVVPYNIIEKQLKLDDKYNLDYNNIFNDGKEVIIYPVQTKKSYSLDLPYSEMFRQFNEAINKNNSTLFIMGYSFLDEHINDIIESSMTNPYINIVIFMFDSKEISKKNKYLKKLIERAGVDNRITIFFGSLLGDFKKIVQELVPIEPEKDPYRELENILKSISNNKNGDK
ncbi:SIR2 family protein [Cetobacterium sp.]|uniref:SIR2 family protein n=1 Tax=Cetobacterium sp. TaxID=2071632 RepID=UPI003F323B11